MHRRLANCFSPTSFHDLAWSEHLDNKRGIVAGALDNGSLKLWDADKLLNGTRLAGRVEYTQIVC
jgi:protein transport protein SEC31